MSTAKEPEMEGVFSAPARARGGALVEGMLVETEHGPGTVKKVLRTEQWFAGRRTIFVTVAVELGDGERRCYSVNALQLRRTNPVVWS